MTYQRQSWGRRLVYTAIVVAIAAGLSWWGSRRETQRYDAIRDRITLLCESLTTDAPASWQYDLASPSVARAVIDRIRDIVSSIPDDDTDAIRIHVAPEGLAPFDRGQATHQALIEVYGLPRLGLLLESHGDPQRMLIVGYWEPENER